MTSAIQDTDSPQTPGVAADGSSWKTAAVLLIATLGLTDVVVFTVGDVAVTLFLVVCALLLPIFLVRWRQHIDLYWMLPIAAWIALNYVVTIHDAKLNSVLFSAIFMMAFIAIMNCLEYLPAALFVRLLKLLIIAYFLNVLISQLLVLVGAPDDFPGGIFHRAVDIREGIGIRFFGFSSEPSYASFVVVTCFVSLCRLPNALERREYVFYGALIVYQVIAFASLYGYLFAMLIAVTTLYRLLARRTFVVMIVLGLVGFAAVEMQGEGRFVTLVGSVITGDLDSAESLNSIDVSTFMRVGPVLEYVDDAEPASPSFYVGYGAMTNTLTYTEIFSKWLDEDFLFRPGFLPGYFYDYGVIGGFMVILIILGLTSDRLLSMPAFIVLTMLFNANFNTQLFWFVVVVFAATKKYCKPLKTDDASEVATLADPLVFA